MFSRWLALFFILNSSVKGADIGSDTSVTRFNTQQIIQNGDRVASFAALEGGFMFVDETVTATWDCFFPVSGDLDFNGGTLYLNRDLVIKNVSNIVSFGNIIGNNHQLMLEASNSVIPTDLSQTVTINTFDLSNLDIYLLDDLLIQNININFIGDCLFNGQGQTLTLSSTTTLRIEDNSVLRFKDIKIKGIQNEIIANRTDTGRIEFDKVTLVIDTLFNFKVGSFDVFNILKIQGENSYFNFNTDQITTITSNSTLFIDNLVTFSYAPSITSQIQLNLLDETSFIYLNGGILSTDTNGVQLIKGKLFVDSLSFLQNAGTSVATGIIFGDGVNSGNNLSVEWLPGAHLDLNSGFFRNANI